MKAYWNTLNERERWMLGIGAVFCFFYLLYLLVFAPLSSAVHKRSQQLKEKRETLDWMQQVSQEYKGKKNQTTLTISNLLTVLANQLNSSSFKQFHYQLQQTGVNDIQLIFDKVPYNDFMTWLWSVNEKYAISIKQFNIERTSVPGIVRLMLVLNVQH